MNNALQRLREWRAGRRASGACRASTARASAEGALRSRGLGRTERGCCIPHDLPGAWREWYEERAAIREYDGGQAREHAEAEALQETVDAMRAAGNLEDAAH